MANAYRDENSIPTLIAASNADGFTPVRVYADPVTHRLLVDISGGSGTVTDVSVATANGFAGTVATSTTTPVITLTTTVTGILKGNGTAISAGTASDVDSILPTQTGNNGKFLTTNGTVSSWGTPAGSGGITIGTTTITSGTTTRILYDNAGVVGEYTLTGTGTVVVMANTPTLITPVLGVATATSINKVAITAPATSATLTIADGKTLTVSNTLTFTGTDTSSVAFGGGGTVLYTTSVIPLTVGTSTITGGTTTRILYDNAGVLGEYTLTGSGTVVVMATAPTFVTSITTPSVLATANDSGALGAAATAFSDLFLASGAVIGFANSNVVLTHSSGILTVSTGELRITTVGTDAASVPTLGSTSTFTNKTLTSPTINTATLGGANQLAEGASIRLDAALSADGTWSGVTIAGTAGAALAFGDLIYLAVADSRWELADADAATTSDRMLGMCVLAATGDGDPTVILLMGNIRADTAFPTLTIGAAAYIGETAGDIQVAIPTGADNVIRRVGYALTADELYFNPSMDSQITVA